MSGRVALIVPCFNDGDLVREALASIDEDEPVEVVVVDDHSTDPATLAILEELSSQWVRVARHGENRGVGPARQTGLLETSAPYVFPLDADDLAVPGALAAMADRLDADPAAAVCFGDYAEFGDSEVLRAVPERLDPYRLAYANEYPIASMFRRSVLDGVGGFTPNGYTGSSYEDWNLWMTLAESGARGVHLGPGRPTYRRRLHGVRKLQSGKRRHTELYRELRREHPLLFERLREHRKSSELSAPRKLLYPVVYGPRRRFRFERRIKSALDRLGVWTLRR
jgi:glycosyltransferase involved in cell wall biosynthesis